MAKGRKTGGRQKGTPNKATREAQEFCASVVDDPAYQASIRRRATRGELAPAVECMMWYYAKGKPRDSLDYSGRQEIAISDAVLVEALKRGRRRAALRNRKTLGTSNYAEPLSSDG